MDTARLRAWGVAAGLSIYSVLHCAGAILWRADSAWPVRACEAFFSLACAVGAVVLIRPTWWARRYALGVGIAGLLNVAAYVAYFHDLGGWCFGVLQGGAFVGLVLGLLGRRMRERYDDLAPHWHFSHPTMHLLAWALSFNVAGIGMLAYYAALDESWTTAPLRLGALGIAAVLAVGSVLGARGRILGLFVMTGAGALSLGLGWLALQHVLAPSYATHACGLWAQWQEWGKWETFKALTGFLPGAVGSLLSFGAFVSPMVRFVRSQ